MYAPKMSNSFFPYKESAFLTLPVVSASSCATSFCDDAGACFLLVSCGRKLVELKSRRAAGGGGSVYALEDVPMRKLMETSEVVALDSFWGAPQGGPIVVLGVHQRKVRACASARGAVAAWVMSCMWQSNLGAVSYLWVLGGSSRGVRSVAGECLSHALAATGWPAVGRHVVVVRRNCGGHRSLPPARRAQLPDARATARRRGRLWWRQAVHGGCAGWCCDSPWTGAGHRGCDVRCAGVARLLRVRRQRDACAQVRSFTWCARHGVFEESVVLPALRRLPAPALCIDVG